MGRLRRGSSCIEGIVNNPSVVRASRGVHPANEWYFRIDNNGGSVVLSDKFRDALVKALVPVLTEALKQAKKATS